MSEISIVRENLMNEEGYTGYCGDMLCRPRTVSSPERWPRTMWDEKLNQFRCPRCGWVSEFPKEFIDRYKAKWNK